MKRRILRFGSIESAVHIDSVLSNLSIMFRNDEFIGQQAIPVVPVAKDSDEYFVYDKSHFRVDETLWAKDTSARQVA